MEKANIVSIWLGYFESEKDFENYIEGSYNEKGDYILSKFERDFKIQYNPDYIERYYNFNGKLENFANGFEIVLKFKKFLEKLNLTKYNSIVILYNFQYNGNIINKKLTYIGYEYTNCCTDKELLEEKSIKDLGQLLINDEKRVILKRFSDKWVKQNLKKLDLTNIGDKENIFLYLDKEDELYLTQRYKILDFIIDNECTIFDFHITSYKKISINNLNKCSKFDLNQYVLIKNSFDIG